jgi:phosphoribosylaminoimidazole-succinocarboxamide synthase
MNIIKNTNFPKLKLAKQGKVRDIYEIEDKYLIVSTDRLSAFDVIMEDGIPQKGKVLNKISEFWFKLTEDIVENHLITTNVEEFPQITNEYKSELEGRSMLVKKAELIPLECIVRGYISGSGWNEYKQSGEICGIKLPHGLVESDRLPEPIFTPSTKAEIGEHDENISEEKAVEIVGRETFDMLKHYTISVYKKIYDYAYSKGIIIADTKLEFGYFNGKVILIDEVITPDSSRFWPKDEYKPGKSQNSYDKQFVRDYLISIGFNKRPPAPILPAEIIQKTSEKYLEAVLILIGETL